MNWKKRFDLTITVYWQNLFKIEKTYVKYTRCQSRKHE